VTNDQGVEKSYRFYQCENTLILQRLSDLAVVDSVELNAVPDYEGLPEIPELGWSLSQNNCTLCSGSLDLDSALPGKEYMSANSASGGYQRHQRGLCGRGDDAVCAYYFYTSAPGDPPMGFTPSPPPHSSVIKRLTGKIYLPDPYNESIIEVDTKLAGTTASMNGSVSFRAVNFLRPMSLQSQFRLRRHSRRILGILAPAFRPGTWIPPY
jgi:hypothetical protein